MTKIKFGTDGWRAIIALDFTVDNVARVTEATAKWMLKQNAKIHFRWNYIIMEIFKKNVFHFFETEKIFLKRKNRLNFMIICKQVASPFFR